MMSISPVMDQFNSVKKKDSNDVNSKEDVVKKNNSSGSSTDDVMNNFMKLLVAQMQNQDPTNPMDNNQLTSQLAQFNTAAGVQQLNSTLNGVGMLVTSMQQMNAAEWVGRTVYVKGDTQIKTNDNGGVGSNKDFAFYVNSDAKEVTVSFKDDAGNVYTGKLKDVKAGFHEYTMDDLSDFKPSDPRNIKNKTFEVSFSATAKDGSSDSPEIISLKHADVKGVSFSQSGAILQLEPDGIAMLKDIYFIK